MSTVRYDRNWPDAIEGGFLALMLGGMLLFLAGVVVLVFWIAPWWGRLGMGAFFGAWAILSVVFYYRDPRVGGQP